MTLARGTKCPMNAERLGVSQSSGALDWHGILLDNRKRRK